MSVVVELLHLGTDHVLALPALTNGETGEVITGATVAVTLVDATGAEVPGQDWPTEMPEDGTTPGRYACVLSADVEVVLGQELAAVVFADGGTGLRRTWYLPLVAAKGGF